MGRIQFSVIIVLLLGSIAAAQTNTTFTYQGELNENGSPVTDVCDFVFRLFNAASGGSQVGGAIAESDVNVSEGRFAAELDFGANAFDNSGRWLRIEVRCPAGAGGYTILNPRQPITRSPYSIQTRGIFVAGNESVGIGTTNPLGGKLQVASLAGGPISAIDASSNNGVFPTIFAQNNASGGPILWAVGNSDVGLNSRGVIVVGNPNGNNIGIDGNEIMARDGGASAPLHLNIQGGEVRMGSAAIHPAFAYGKLGDNLNIVSSSSNVNGMTQHPDGVFRIGFAGGLNSNDIAIVTPRARRWTISVRITSQGQLSLQGYNEATNSFGHVPFSFIVYRP